MEYKTKYVCLSKDSSYNGHDTPEEAIREASEFYNKGVKINLFKISLEDSFEIDKKGEK